MSFDLHNLEHRSELALAMSKSQNATIHISVPSEDSTWDDVEIVGGNKITYEEALALWQPANSDNKLNELRHTRNQMIKESDWMANSDVEMSDAWKAYRQALRDITDNYTSMDDVVWPTKPE